MARGSRNVAVIGPEATPPESKAIAVKMGGTKNVMIMEKRYAGMRMYQIEIPVMTRTIASPTETATPIQRAKPIDFPLILPSVTSSTCCLST